MIGELRDRPVWVGGRSPTEAAYVAPPPELVLALMDDLVKFANADALDVVTQAAIVHAQFESIHPFADGNGRLGRVLIGWLLVRRLGVLVPPPFSLFMAQDPGGYLSGLTLYRLDQLSHWVQWFAGTLEKSANAASSLVVDIEELMVGWRQRAATVKTAGGRPVRTVRRSGLCSTCCRITRSSPHRSWPGASASPMRRPAWYYTASHSSASCRHSSCARACPADQCAGGSLQT